MGRRRSDDRLLKDAADVGRTKLAHPFEIFKFTVIGGQLFVGMELAVGIVVKADGLYLVIFEEDSHFTGKSGVDSDKRAILFLYVVQTFGVAHHIHAAKLSPMDSSSNGDTSNLIKLSLLKE